MKAKYFLSLYALIFTGNLILNILNSPSENSINTYLIYKISSFILVSTFYYLLSKVINDALNLNSLSLSISLFLISYFLFDHLMIFTDGYFSFDITVIVVSMIWIVIVYKNKKIHTFTYF